MIEMRDVEIKYGDFVAMQDMNLTVNEGEFFTLLGPSGCGKTTTLRTLVGFVKASKGDIFVSGKRVNDMAVEKRGISMVFQSYALFPTMSVYDNIAFGLTVKKLSKSEIATLVKDIAEKVELTDEQLKKKVSELSGGQQQRVAIARALILKPKILVLDEPLSNLDANLRGQLRLELKQLQKNFGITTIYVTHDQEEALTLSDRIAVFNKGRIEQIGTPREIYNESKTKFVCNFIGSINKFSPESMKEMNKTVGTFDESKEGYIRLEKILTTPSETAILLKTRVIESEFFGNFTKYTYAFGENIIKNIEKEDGKHHFNIDDEVDLYIEPENIMQF